MRRQKPPETWLSVGLVVAFAVVVAPGCKPKRKSADTEARELTRCGKGTDGCRGKNLCVYGADGESGVCVQPCKGPGGCLAGFRCSGNYVRAYKTGGQIGRSRPYCQKAELKIGEACGEVGRGCVEGAACFGGRCVKVCSRDGTCGSDQKCVAIYQKDDPYVLPWMRKAAYRGCVPATIPHEGKCEDGKAPLCKEGLECLGGACARRCAKDAECPAGRKCHPVVGEVQRSIVRKEMETLFHACQPASLPEGAACQPSRWPLCQRGARCFGGRCARLCEKDGQCAEGTRCVRVTKKVGLLKDKEQTLYHACLKATLGEDAPCGPKADDRCGRGHRCHKGRCVKTCRAHEDCAAGRECNAMGFFPKNAVKEPTAEVLGHRADFYYCRPGERRLAPRATYNKCASGKQCLPKHVCVRGKCRPICETVEGCPKYLGNAVPCKTVVSKADQGKTWKVCLGLL